MEFSRQIPDLSAGSDSANWAVSQTALPSTSAFTDIKRMIDQPELEAFHTDLSSSDFERIRVAKQEPEALSDEDNDFLTCGSGIKNGEKRKQRENSLHKSKWVKTVNEQSLETCEREKGRDSEILAITPIGHLNSNSNAVCLANSDVGKWIKQEPEWNSILDSPVPTMNSENPSRVALYENCDRGMIESVQDSVINSRVLSIVSEKLSLKQESQSLVDFPVGDNRNMENSDATAIAKKIKLERKDPVGDYHVSSSDIVQDMEMTVESVAADPDSADCKSIAIDVMNLIFESDSEQDGLLSNNASNAFLSSYVKDEPITDDSIAKYPVQLSNKSDKCKDGDISAEDFNPDEQLSDDDEVEIANPTTISEDLATDEQLLDDIIYIVKSTPLFKPFCETELETLALEVLKHWKTKGLPSSRMVKTIISSYIQQNPKYLQMLKTYVHDGMDEDAIRSLPSGFYYGAKPIYLRVKCPVCYKTITRRLFDNHMNSHADRRPHNCEKCGRGYLSEKALHAHERESKCSGMPFKCKVCGKPYENKSALRNHEKLHDPNRKKHQCHLCHAVFRYPSYLKDHVASHTNAEDPSQLAKPYQCHVCNKQFITKQLMNRHHSSVHLKKAWKPRECRKCNAKFKNPYQYHKHTLLHSKGTEKPFKCPHCDKRFTLKRVLQNHIMTHTGEKPYKCDICDHAFTGKVTLKNHKFTHQGRKLYRCDKCGKDSQRERDIIEHKCPMDKSSKVSTEDDQDPVPAPVINKAKKLSSTSKKQAFHSKFVISKESDKSKDVRNSRSKSEKESFKEYDYSDDDESSTEVSSEDEDFKPDEQFSDVEDGILKSTDIIIISA